MSQPDGDTYFLYLLGVLRRRWVVVLLCALVVPAVALALSLTQPKEYAAKAQLLFQDARFDQAVFGANQTQATDPAREAATNLKLVDLDAVGDRAARRLGLSPADVREAIKVSPEGNANLVAIVASWSEPRFAARMADTYARQYIAFRRDAQRGQLRSAQRVVERQLARLTPAARASGDAQSLEDRANQLRILAALQTGDAELVSPAGVPSDPSSPHPRRDVVLGLLLGLVLGVGLALLIDRIDRRVRDADEVRRALRAPVLGSVPLGRRLPASGALEPATADAFGALHANLRYFELERELRSVMVTSLDATDGRSPVAWHVATAAADSGARVLLIRADLRAAGAEPGLTTVLAHGAALSEVVVRTTVAGSGSLDVLEPGPDAGTPMSLLATPRMAELLSRAQLDYDLVDVDAPPLGTVPDGIPLAKGVDGVLVVVRTRAHSAQALRSLRAELDHLGVRIVGAVLTGTRRSTERYGSVDLSPSLDPS
jgi:capsular exopolysaccharide synthesis family protein